LNFLFEFLIFLVGNQVNFRGVLQQIEQNQSTAKTTLERITNWIKRAESLGFVEKNGSMREKMIEKRNLLSRTKSYGDD
jgi:hypothetical protein